MLTKWLMGDQPAGTQSGTAAATVPSPVPPPPPEPDTAATPSASSTPAKPKVTFIQPASDEVPEAPIAAAPAPEPAVSSPAPSEAEETKSEGIIEMSEQLEQADTAAPLGSSLTTELLEQALEASEEPAAQPAPAVESPAPEPAPAAEPAPQPIPAEEKPAEPIVEKAEKAEDPANLFPSLSTKQDASDIRNKQVETPVQLPEDSSLPKVDLPDVSSEIKRLLQDRWVTLANDKLSELAARREDVIATLTQVETQQRELADRKHNLESERDQIIKETESWNAKLEEARKALDKIVEEVANI